LRNGDPELLNRFNHSGERIQYDYLVSACRLAQSAASSASPSASATAGTSPPG
jgi:hypothetical protein